RTQQEALKAREKILFEKIAQKVAEQRESLRKVEELLQQLQTPSPDERKLPEKTVDAKKEDTKKLPKSH
ncbi:MAG TPA: hypothetical protein VKE94_16575, partial [Gemmataceae bacterium]|nr:hypothetical protein [Gemmataceae bacterium]